eukprot:gnl/MRDRNA2_/MRDRNA2_85362_c2_seq3.p1 gnl/MRDRNA2_/MRDRNA2_85362_c2~~gnl/MRDRNA2_/MRDRNA2_85362_c2_seq3.p1  ORF type:complete len:526 (-),score=84.87 gnl/MRDRNA2_/MRDRNA2_85362_c2_seq3:419-1996(-)
MSKKFAWAQELTQSVPQQQSRQLTSFPKLPKGRSGKQAQSVGNLASPAVSGSSSNSQCHASEMMALEVYSSPIPVPHQVDLSRCDTPPPWWPPGSLSMGAALELPPLPDAAENPPSSKPTRSSSNTFQSKVATVLNRILPLYPSSSEKSTRAETKPHQMSKQLSGLFGTANVHDKAELPNPTESYVSLVDFRRWMLKQFGNLTEAFVSLECHANKNRCRGSKQSSSESVTAKQLSLSEFTDALSFFGFSTQQSHHFFANLDANHSGCLTLAEFKKGLSADMPRHVLLQDLRTRLLSTHLTLPDAFRALGVSASRELGRKAFTTTLLRWKIADEEATKLFALIDIDGSETISLEEMREALREFAPWVSLKEFFCRFARQWPDIAELSGTGAQAYRRAAKKLFAHISARNHPAQLRREKEIPETLTQGAFIEICSQLDITDGNALELFALCTTSAKWQHRSVETNLDEYALDDFFENLKLWSDNSLSVSSLHCTPAEIRQRSGKTIAKYLSPAQGILNALKRQLQRT